MSALWMTTITGRDHFLAGCESYLNEVDVYEIAHALAQVNRFNGHATRPYSVAEHSLLVADLAAHDGHGPLMQLLCLLHDAHEAYTGDATSPQKNAIGLGWATFEHRHADHVRRSLHVVTGFAARKQQVNHYDLVALATERRDLTRFDATRNRAWLIDLPGSVVEPASWVNLNALERVNATWIDWKNAFLTRLLDLQRAVQAEADANTQPFHHVT
jgi:hypothetical protein